MFPFVSPAMSLATSVAASASSAAAAARTCIGRRVAQPLIQPAPEPLVPRFPAMEPDLINLARRMPTEGGIVVTDRADRVPAISFNFVQSIGLAASAQVVIMIAPTTEAERAEVERLKTTGQLRPIFHDPAMPDYRQPKPVPLPDTVEDLIAAQARDMRRRLKLEKKAARHERRSGHHAKMLELIDGLEARSCVIFVQSWAYAQHLIQTIQSRRPDLASPRLAIFVQVWPPDRPDYEALEQLPDYAQALPIYRAPGLGIARDRAAQRRLRELCAPVAETAANASPADVQAAAPAGHAADHPDAAERVADLQQNLAGMLESVDRLIGAFERLRSEMEADRRVQHRLDAIRGHYR